MNTLFLIILAVLPSILIINYINNKDREKEPKELLISLFLYGILSAIVTLIIDLILTSFGVPDTHEGLNSINLLLYVFIVIALVEEISKWIMVYLKSYNHHHFDHIYDMIVYSTIVSLGFATFENILYVMDRGIVAALLRFITAVPGHACFAVFMGYYLGLAKVNEINKNASAKKYKILSIVVPTILHGFYDFCLMSGNLILFLCVLIFIIWMYINTIKKINRISSVPLKFKNKIAYCPLCGTKVTSDYCSTCGKKLN